MNTKRITDEKDRKEDEGERGGIGIRGRRIYSNENLVGEAK